MSINPSGRKTRSEVNACATTGRDAVLGRVPSSSSRPLPGSRPTSENARSATSETDVRKWRGRRRQSTHPADDVGGQRKFILSATPLLETDARKWTVILTDARKDQMSPPSTHPTGSNVGGSQRVKMALFCIILRFSLHININMCTCPC